MQGRRSSVLIMLMLLLAEYPSFASEFTISGCIVGTGNSGIYLYRFYGDLEIKTDSAKTTSEGCFTFHLDESQPPGQYRLIFNGNRFLDLIFNHGDIRFSTTLDHLIDSIRFTVSEENDLYYRYLKFRSKSRYRIRQLQKQLQSLPEDNPQYRSTRQEIMSLVKQENDFTSELLKGRENYFAARLIHIDREPLPDPAWPKEFRNRYVFSRFLGYLDYSDTLLLYTNALSAEIISYLSVVTALWPDPDSTAYGFRLAAFNLLAASGNSEKMLSYIKSYLIRGFTRLGYIRLAEELDTISYRDDCFAGAFTPFTSSDKEMLTGKKFPVFSKIKGCMKQQTDGNTEGFLIILSVPGCIWDEILRHNVLQSLSISSYSKYMAVTIATEATSVIPVHETENICIPGKKEYAKIHRFAGRHHAPLLIVTDSEGTIVKTAGSWAALIKVSEL